MITILHSHEYDYNVYKDTLHNISRINIQYEEIPFLIQEEYCDKLTNLRELRMTECKLKEIPKYISKLNSLEIISFSHNNIVEIPDELFQLPNLHSLILMSNNIKNIKCDLTKIKIRFLNLRFNFIEDLSGIIIENSDYRFVCVSDNPLLGVEESDFTTFKNVHEKNINYIKAMNGKKRVFI